MPTVAALNVYPVKGLRGHAVEEVLVEPWGLAADRRFVVVDDSGRFLTQRDLPRMATIDAAWDGSALVLSAAGHEVLRAVPGPAGPDMVVTVWRDRVPARALPLDADAWIAAVLGRPCRLAFMDDPARARPADPAYARAADRVSFADSFPVLLTSSASLDDLNARFVAPIGMDRFRPNLVVTGAPAWAEDGWQTLRIGEALFDRVKPCARCIVTTTDQRTGHRAPDLEPIRTLKTFRRDPSGQVLFGQNLVPRRCGRIAAGDPVEVVA